MGRRPKLTFLQRKHTGGQQRHERMLNIANYWRNANQKPQWGNTTHQSERPSLKSLNKCWKGCGEKGALLRCWWECKLVHPLWKAIWRFLKKLIVTIWSSNSTPGHILRENSNLKRHNMYPNVQDSTICNSQEWKHHKCPSTDDWFKRMWWNTTQSLKKKLPFTAAWMDLENIILSEVSQRKILYGIIMLESKK